jgi:hypothetical protein
VTLINIGTRTVNFDHVTVIHWRGDGTALVQFANAPAIEVAGREQSELQILVTRITAREKERANEQH